MIAAGLVAKKAVEKGLKVPPLCEDFSLSPGSARGDGIFREKQD